MPIPPNGSDIKSMTIYCHMPAYFFLRPEMLRAVLSLAWMPMALFLHKASPQ